MARGPNPATLVIIGIIVLMLGGGATMVYFASTSGLDDTFMEDARPTRRE